MYGFPARPGVAFDAYIVPTIHVTGITQILHIEYAHFIGITMDAS
jgi:hypothetical protein